MLFPSGVLFIQCMPVAPQAPEEGKFSEAERQRRKDEREARKRGEVTDGIIELRVRPLVKCLYSLTSSLIVLVAFFLQMMSLEEESDDDDD